MDVFDLRKTIIADYGDYVGSFLTTKDDRIQRMVEKEIKEGLLWPEPLVQLNPSFEPGETLEALIEQKVLLPECLKIFSRKDAHGQPGTSIRLHRHQVEGIHAARAKESYVLTTGTGSGKSLSYIVPIVDAILRQPHTRKIKAIIVYPMNALANSQMGELEKFLCNGYPKDNPPVRFKRYTGQESREEKDDIIQNPPDILLTNYVMLELVLTRVYERKLVDAAQGLQFLVLDELHTYRGRQGGDVALLVRRVKETLQAKDLLCIGTSATISGGQTWEDQQRDVATVASTLFGTTVKPERIIGETLRRVTPLPTAITHFQQKLTQVIEQQQDPPQEPEAFLQDPLSAWIESTLGLREDPVSGRLVRAMPLPLSGPGSASLKLSQETNQPATLCEAAIRRTLLAGYELKDENQRPLFAFRLHQFISKGDAVYASIDFEENRFLTLQAQEFVPNSERSQRLLPLVFCRECGQEYYSVRRCTPKEGKVFYERRELSDRSKEDDSTPGYLHISKSSPWPSEPSEVLKRIPESWLENEDGTPKLKKHQREHLPRPVHLSALAIEGDGSQLAHFMEAPFLFCLHCGVSYNARQSSDFGKLSTLGSEGRSTATTILSLSTIRHLRQENSLPKEAQKMLSFTDNRQDASLQAGHFNDFVEVGLLRSALWKATQASSAGLRHDVLTQKVFEAMELPLSLYARNPEVEYVQLEDTERALRDAIGYYLYVDLRRGWRITSPNLEQSGLLEIDYLSLSKLCTDTPKWNKLHSVLSGATPKERETACRVLLDYMRRELAIRVDYLEGQEQERMQQRSGQYLIEPWALHEYDKLERSKVMIPQAKGDITAQLKPHHVFLSPRGGVGLYLKRPTTFSSNSAVLKTEDIAQIINDLLQVLKLAGVVTLIEEKQKFGQLKGYQINASAMLWKSGAGTTAFHDPVRMPNIPEQGLRTNPFFVDLYQKALETLKNLEAREHTAQVPNEARKEREKLFREGSLPILYCSPTMELGVDIAQLNVVNLRNVPPTPANYAQRSGRAGRSGQPALVFSYCTAGSPHDQYFFKRPEQMVAGSVTTPRMDLRNEELLRSHVNAVWLEVARFPLGKTMKDLLDVAGEEPSLELRDNIKLILQDASLQVRAKVKAKAALGVDVAAFLGTNEVDEWLAHVTQEIPGRFVLACERWKGLYRAAHQQAKLQNKIILDASRSHDEKKEAERLRREAEAQLKLLGVDEEDQQSEFNPYRYLASEGFLPGYNFPRLPLSAYLPARRRQKDDEEFLSRPRFLAISEFGPRSVIYHEGSRYLVNRVIFSVEGDESPLHRRAVQCDNCGYLHPIRDITPPDVCDHCKEKLPLPLTNLFRMQNVSTRKRDRINSDEEERLRLGYELKTGVRFAQRSGEVSAQIAILKDEQGESLAKLTYGHAATLWRMNLGWRRRKNKEQLGYMLDIERGYWGKNDTAEDDPEDPMSKRTERVVPYVEDTRNCLLIEPSKPLSVEEMASLEAAIKIALQVQFQLEDREIATEPLPRSDDRKLLLFYEASEGGAGVLRRLVEDPTILLQTARLALELNHFHPDTLADQGKSIKARERCEAACYDCLLSYFNQREHRILDRKLLPPLLARWMKGKVEASSTMIPRAEQVEKFKLRADSRLEQRWIQMVTDLGLRLPTHTQYYIEAANCKPDYFYKEHNLAIFIDGPPHDEPAQKAKDKQIDETLSELGGSSLRFHHKADWEKIFASYQGIFGVIQRRPKATVASETPPKKPAVELELFDEYLHPVLLALAEKPGVEVLPGEDVSANGRVVGMDLATIRYQQKRLALLGAGAEDLVPVEIARKAQGYLTLRVNPDDTDTLAQIISILEATAFSG